MKRITQLLTALVFCSLIIFISCGGDDDSNTDPLDEVGTALEKTWTVTSATLDNASRSEWTDAGFTITVSDFDSKSNSGTISFANIPSYDGASDVWGEEGTWTFGSTTSSPYTIVRPDDVSMSVTFDAANPTSVTLAFDIESTSTSSSRVAGFTGSWVFVFE